MKLLCEPWRRDRSALLCGPDSGDALRHPPARLAV
jgi:hypothetical protein